MNIRQSTGTVVQVGNSRVGMSIQYVPTAISRTSGHRSSTPNVVFGCQVMTSYLCSIVTSRSTCNRWRVIKAAKVCVLIVLEVLVAVVQSI